MENIIFHPFQFLYLLWQYFLDKLLSPKPPKHKDDLSRPKIAIIGAGLTGVSAASHCVGHGYDVHIFEAGPREELGGIWSVSIIFSSLFTQFILVSRRPPWQRLPGGQQSVIPSCYNKWCRSSLTHWISNNR